jgi:hypothetical protein
MISNRREWPSIRNLSRNLCDWHKADVTAVLIHVRFQGKADIAANRSRTKAEREGFWLKR